MRKLLLVSAAIASLAASTFAPNAFATSGGDAALPSAAEIQRIQERQSVLLDAHLAGMKAGLKLNEEQAKNWPAFESAIRDAAKARSDRWASPTSRIGPFFASPHQRNQRVDEKGLHYGRLGRKRGADVLVGGPDRHNWRFMRGGTHHDTHDAA